MNKINFQNGITPLNDTNLNQMQSNMEEVGVVVSPTQPTTNEKVWIQKGKNLLNLSGFKTQTINGVTFTNNGDGSITINGTSSNAFGFSFVRLKLKVGTYSLSLNGNVPSDVYIYDYDSNANILNKEATANLTKDYNNIALDMWINEGTLFDNVIIKPMLNIGNILPFEAHVEKAIYVKNDNGVYEPFYKENKGSKVLWTNPNPTTSIGYTRKGITLSSEDYDELEFWCDPYGYNTELVCIKTKKGYSTSITSLNGYAGNIFARGFAYISNTEYTINACYAYGKDYPTPPIEANGFLIPVFVIGYKNTTD